MVYRLKIDRPLNTNLGSFNMKTFHSTDLGDTDNSHGLNWYIEAGHLPKGSLVEVSAFSGTAMHDDLVEANITDYGFIYIYRSFSGASYYVYFIPYSQPKYLYYNSYTTINSIGWNQFWKRITLTDFNPY